MTNDFIRITLASVIARMASVSLNFQINSHLVFAKGNSGSAKRAFWRFMALAACVLTLSCLGVWFCHEFLDIPDYVAKVGVDFCLFFLNYNVQRKWIFVDRPSFARAEAMA
jgi:dolichol-phosphate mannosyltransferase